MASGSRSSAELVRQLEDQQAELVEAVERLSVRVEMEFDSTLWSKLPANVMKMVLACLPETALCRFRTVSKEWGSLVLESRFRELRGRLRPKRAATVLVSGDYKAVEVYDRDESKWLFMDVTFLRAVFAAVDVTTYKIEAAAGGLLAVWSAATWPDKNQKRETVVICNPVAKTWRYLPAMVIPMKTRSPSFVYMVVDSETSAVRIFVHGSCRYRPGLEGPSFQIYDSDRVDSWRLCSCPPRGSNHPLSGLLYNGRYHALVYDIIEESHVLMAYDEAEDVWADVGVDHFPSLPETGELLVANSRLYLVTPCAETGGQPTRYVSSVDISEIRISVGECARVKLPSSAFNVLFGSSSSVTPRSYVTMVFDQSICFVSYLGLAVVHDEVADQWQSMKPCGMLRKSGEVLGSSFVIDVCMPV